MMLQPGMFLGPYEILALIGKGGMGEVYKARDTRLDRLVAIKTLPAHLAERPNLRERFEREAKTLANLKHPHICVLYDIGKQDGIDYLVMEYLEGETLAQRLKKGPLPLDQVLRYAIEISDAMDKAHRSGITHRDIKPANLMLTQLGSKLLDFGLAKLKKEIAQATIPPSEFPTAPGTLTQHGTLLGTLQYMAPEQLEAKTDEQEPRTDIFAFGAVVYEMMTGKRAFEGQSQASVIAAIVERQPPPMISIQPMTPPALDRTIKRCLAKDPDNRWQTARDLEQELRWIADVTAHPELTGSALPAKPAGVSRRRVLLGSAAALVLAALVGLAAWTYKPTPPLAVTRTVIALPPGERLASLEQQAVVISPDGKLIAYVADRGGMRQLYLRAVDSFETKPIPGTEGASSPFFSPDSQWLGFFAESKFKKVSITGGAPITLSNAPASISASATWGPGDAIAFQTINISSLFQVSASGGTPQPLTTLDPQKGEVSHRWPAFLPDGKAVFFAAGFSAFNWTNSKIVMRIQPGGERRDLIQGGTRPSYAPTGHLLYAQGGTLMAAPFDPRRLEVTGASVPVVESILQSPTSGVAQYSVSANGSLVYVPGGLRSPMSRLVWVDRKGAEQPLPAHLTRRAAGGCSGS